MSPAFAVIAVSDPPSPRAWKPQPPSSLTPRLVPTDVAWVPLVIRPVCIPGGIRLGAWHGLAGAASVGAGSPLGYDQARRPGNNGSDLSDPRLSQPDPGSRRTARDRRCETHRRLPRTAAPVRPASASTVSLTGSLISNRLLIGNASRAAVHKGGKDTNEALHR